MSSLKPNMNMDRKQLLQWINEVSFAVIEISLYLDTHPDDTDALDFFLHYNEERKKAVELYSSTYAPLLMDKIDDTNYWHWATEPWPWEGGYC